MKKQKLTCKDIKNAIWNIKWIVQYPKESNTIILTGCWALILLPFVLTIALRSLVSWFDKRKRTGK